MLLFIGLKICTFKIILFFQLKIKNFSQILFIKKFLYLDYIFNIIINLIYNNIIDLKKIINLILTYFLQK